MCSWVRTVMMWLLMAALPVQSWAIATMAHCAPSHHRMAAGGAHGNAHDAAHAAGHEAHAGHDSAAHHHADASPVDGHSTAEASNTQSDTRSEANPLHLGKFKCSACATCGLGLALPSTTVTFDASVSPDTLQPGMPQGHAVFLTAGPERPPRSFLA